MNNVFKVIRTIDIESINANQPCITTRSMGHKKESGRTWFAKQESGGKEDLIYLDSADKREDNRPSKISGMNCVVIKIKYVSMKLNCVYSTVFHMKNGKKIGQEKEYKWNAYGKNVF